MDRKQEFRGLANNFYALFNPFDPVELKEQITIELTPGEIREDLEWKEGPTRPHGCCDPAPA